MAEIFQTLVEVGHDIHRIRDEYTIDQVYLFYEKTKKLEMERNRMNAIIFAKAVYCMSSSDNQQAANAKNRDWKQFMDALDFDKLTKPKDLKKSFAIAGIPIITPKKKQVK